MEKRATPTNGFAARGSTSESLVPRWTPRRDLPREVSAFSRKFVEHFHVRTIKPRNTKRIVFLRPVDGSGWRICFVFHLHQMAATMLKDIPALLSGDIKPPRRLREIFEYCKSSSCIHLQPSARCLQQCLFLHHTPSPLVLASLFTSLYTPLSYTSEMSMGFVVIQICPPCRAFQQFLS